MIKYYKNAGNETAKIIISNASTVIMFKFRTMFFPDPETAKIYLNSIGFYCQYIGRYYGGLFFACYGTLKVFDSLYTHCFIWS